MTLDSAGVTALEVRRFVARVLEEHGLEPRGFARPGPVRFSRVAPWSLSAVAVGLVLVLLFPGGDRAPDSSQSAAAHPTLEPIAPDSSIDESEDAEDPDASFPPPSRRQQGPALQEAQPSLSQPRRSKSGRFTARFAPAPRRSSVVTVAARSTGGKAPGYRGSLVIYSYPPGAQVTVDGQIVGYTPLAVTQVRVGSRLVRVEAAGFERWSTAARVVANRQTRLTAQLQPGAGQ